MIKHLMPVWSILSFRATLNNAEDINFPFEVPVISQVNIETRSINAVRPPAGRLMILEGR